MSQPSPEQARPEAAPMADASVAAPPPDEDPVYFHAARLCEVARRYLLAPELRACVDALESALREHRAS